MSGNPRTTAEECQAVTVEERLRGATQSKVEVVAGKSYPMSEVSGSQEETSLHLRSGAASKEELPCF